jgi:hypothetical protein
VVMGLSAQFGLLPALRFGFSKKNFNIFLHLPFCNTIKEYELQSTHEFFFCEKPFPRFFVSTISQKWICWVTLVTDSWGVMGTLHQNRVTANQEGGHPTPTLNMVLLRNIKDKTSKPKKSQLQNIPLHKVLPTKCPSPKTSQPHNVPSPKMSQPQNVPNLKKPQTSKCPKPQNVPNLIMSETS